MEKEIKTKQDESLKVIIGLLIVGLVLIGISSWLGRERFKTKVKTVPITEIQLKEDSTPVIMKDIENIKLPNLDEEFKEIDQDLNSL
jgi:hypothetical protein